MNLLWNKFQRKLSGLKKIHILLLAILLIYFCLLLILVFLSKVYGIYQFDANEIQPLDFKVILIISFIVLFYYALVYTLFKSRKIKTIANIVLITSIFIFNTFNIYHTGYAQVYRFMSPDQKHELIVVESNYNKPSHDDTYIKLSKYFVKKEPNNITDSNTPFLNSKFTKGIVTVSWEGNKAIINVSGQITTINFD